MEVDAGWDGFSSMSRHLRHAGTTHCTNRVQGEESPCVLRKLVTVSYDSRHLWYTPGSWSNAVSPPGSPIRDKKVYTYSVWLKMKPLSTSAAFGSAWLSSLLRRAFTETWLLVWPYEESASVSGKLTALLKLSSQEVAVVANESRY